MADRAPPINRIEGGIDAIVIGASMDGMVAAAKLARAGIKTVLVDHRLKPSPDTQTDIAHTDMAGSDIIMPQGMVMDLDRQVVNSLDLVRHGLAFKYRRIGTVYVSDGAAWARDPGDVRQLAYLDGTEGEGRAGGHVSALMENILASADALRAASSQAAFDASVAALIGPDINLPLTEFLGKTLKGARLEAALMTEAVFGRENRPDAPFTAAALIARYAGSVAALSGGLGYPVDGMNGLMTALRRAGQAHGVDYRQHAEVDHILIEWDRAAGVQLKDGAQLRAPIVVNALSAEEAFIQQIGKARLDIEFCAGIKQARARHCYLSCDIEFRAPALDFMEGNDPARRIVLARTAGEICAAFAACEKQAVPEKPVVSLFLTGDPAGDAYGDSGGDSSSDSGETGRDADDKSGEGPQARVQAGAQAGAQAGVWGEGAKRYRAIMHLGPFAQGSAVPEGAALRAIIHRVVRELLPALQSDNASEAENAYPSDDGSGPDDIVLRASARMAGLPVPAAQYARRHLLLGTDDIRGYYFCGPEVSAGPSPSGAAGARAASAAIRYLKEVA